MPSNTPSHPPQRKRKISRCSNSEPQPPTSQQHVSTGAPVPPLAAPAQPNTEVDHLVKRLRVLEQENAQLKARVATSETNVQILAEHLSAREERANCFRQQHLREQRELRRLEQDANAQFGGARKAADFTSFELEDTPPTSPRGVVDSFAQPAPQPQPQSDGGAPRQRINSPRQFYLTLLAMYCSAFAHVMHGPDSENPIVSAADQHTHDFFSKPIFTTSNTNTRSPACFNAAAHGTASAEAGMASEKYERMLRASSHGLLRLIQFRRKIVRDRARTRREAMMASAPVKRALRDERLQ